MSASSAETTNLSTRSEELDVSVILLLLAIVFLPFLAPVFLPVVAICLDDDQN